MGKKLAISKCLDCPHLSSVTRRDSTTARMDQVPICRKYHYRQMASTRSIPEWCPLEDDVLQVVHPAGPGEHTLMVFSMDGGIRPLEMEPGSIVAGAPDVYSPARCPFCSVAPGVRVLGDEFVEVMHPEGSCVYGGHVFPPEQWPPANNDSHCSYPVCRCTLGEDRVCPRGLPDLEYKSAAVPRALY